MGYLFNKEEYKFSKVIKGRLTSVRRAIVSISTYEYAEGSHSWNSESWWTYGNTQTPFCLPFNKAIAEVILK